MKKVDHMSLVNYSYTDTSEFIRACLGRGRDDIKFVSAVMNKTNGNPALIMQAIQRLFNEKKYTWILRVLGTFLKLHHFKILL